ncbi:CaiB/BaiF CoA transferase family protein [Bradyrhizobium oligotrophicum]|uniref:CaiB/BaiF CoA transferase family protein n=1 Tax=Bradyrhizobium oligotrophicum TaxID=44255 RepID=UPI00034CCFF8|nr:CaiB/BaiF CoA-transferase family protein [Bradyrhizobium oligotrophicum]
MIWLSSGWPATSLLGGRGDLVAAVFQGLKVIDSATFVAGPAAAVILADFGADVVKIEPVGVGDPQRVLGRLPNLPKADHNYAWTVAARSKRTLGLDLKTETGRTILGQLVRSADVFITNQSPASRTRLGISYEQLSEINPRLVYAALTGYGETGPEAERPGFDAHAYWARSGLADNVRPDLESSPAAPTLGMGDQPTAVTLYAGIVTALLHRERTGRGSYVTSSLLANGVWSNAASIQAVLCGGEIQYRLPRKATRNALTCFYRCADDRWFMISLVQEERDWPRFCDAIDRSALIEDSRFSALATRRANAAELVALLDDLFASRISSDWQRIFQAADLTAAIVAKAGDLVGDDQMYHAGALVRAEWMPGRGAIVDSPFRISGVTKRPPSPAPELGQHSGEILEELGYSDEEIARLKVSGVVG